MKEKYNSLIDREAAFFLRQNRHILRRGRITLLLVGMLLTGHSVYSQSPPALPMLTASSPKASMINRYGDYPVSLYTGMVDITIPIYEININGITVPVEFKYHASGLKFDDLPMELGYGWTLMAGGTVTQSPRGTPETGSLSGYGIRTSPYFWAKDINQIQKYLSTESTGNPFNDQMWLRTIVKGVEYPWSQNNTTYYSDSEYDLFSYNFLRYSGQIYSCDGSSFNVPANGMYVKGSLLGAVLTLVDNDGITHNFTKMEWDDWSNNVWYLTAIISANKADTITFNYTYYGNDNAVEKLVINGWFEYINRTAGGGGDQSDIFEMKGGKAFKAFYPPRLNSIQYRGGKIEFIYTNLPTTAKSRNLSEIRIYDNRNVLYKTAKLVKPRTDWLDGIEFRDNINAIQQTYAFEYNGTIPSPPTQGIDYWGYYNGKNSSGNYLPNFKITSSYTIPGMDRTPSSSQMQQGVLVKIVYPTKGYTKFWYEPHKSSNVIYGGLRIQQIDNYNHDGTLVERKWYKYGAGESGNGRAVKPFPEISDFRRMAFLVEFNVLSVGYSTFNRLSYINFYYPFPLTSYFASGSTVVYPEVAEYSGTGSVTNGKTVYKYTDTPDDNTNFTFRGQIPPQKYKTWHWKNGLLESKRVYNSSSDMVYLLNNYYSYLSTSETLNLGVTQYADLINYGADGPGADHIKNNLNGTTGEMKAFASLVNGTLYDYYNYYITTGIPVIASSEESLDGVTTTTTYSGHNEIGLARQVQVTKSNGDNLITKYKYPADLGATAPYNTMVTNNILTPVIHQEQYKGTTFLSKSVNEYKNWGSNIFEPEILKYQATTTASIENRITYHNRDSRGNLRYISKDDADKVVYLWGYSQQYPIAEIVGATYSEVTAKIAESTLNTIAAKNEPAPTDFTTINNLRSQLPNALITTYTYRPLVGILTMTDPRGVVTKYDYDSFGRLNKTTKADRVIETYDYHYKN